MEQRNMSVDLNRGLAPILNWLSIIGVELKKKYSNRRRCLVTMYQLIWFVGCITPHIITVFHAFEDQSFVWIPAEKHNPSFVIVLFLDSIADFIHPTGVFLSLMYHSKEWADLWNSFDATRFFMNAESFNRLRRLISIGIVYIILSVQLALWSIFQINFWINETFFCLGSLFYVNSSLLFYYHRSSW